MSAKLYIRRSSPVSHVRFSVWFWFYSIFFVKRRINSFQSIRDFFQKKNTFVVTMKPRNKLRMKVTLQIQPENVTKATLYQEHNP